MAAAIQSPAKCEVRSGMQLLRNTIIVKEMRTIKEIYERRKKRN
jgi:hypothetical protein